MTKSKGYSCSSWLLAGVLALSLAACRSRATPTVVPPATSTTAVVAMPTAPSAATPVRSATQLGDYRSVVLELPDDWVSVELAGPDLASGLAELKTETALPPVREELHLLHAAAADASSVLVAREPRANGGAGVVLLVLSANELDLRDYLAGARSQLAMTPGVTVVQAEIDDALRADGTPIAVLHYRMEGAAAGGEAMTGYQVGMLDDAGERLILMTFTAPTQRFAALLPVLRAIGASATLRTTQVGD